MIEGDEASGKPPKQRAELGIDVILAALFAVGYGAYVLATFGRGNFHGVLLVAFGLVAFAGLLLARRWPGAAWFPVLLGWYVFGILGCVRVGLALAARSHWQVAAKCVLWLAFGWFALSAAQRFRRSVTRLRDPAAPDAGS